MANRTVSSASTIHGTDPQFLIEKIVRTRIHESRYWKEHCTLLNSALVLEKAIDDLRYVGGCIGANVKPTPFLCLILKLLQIQPIREIIYLYIEQTDFKYLRILGAFYLRLVGGSIEIHTKLEPLLKDYRKVRIVDKTNKFSVIHIDDLIDNLLREERVFDVILPRMTKRSVLEANKDIEPYISELEEQNLIPTQIIEEKAEQTLEKYRRNEHGKRRNHYSMDDRRHSGREQDHYKSHDRNYSKTPVNKGRFRQEEIDNENAIRAKLGLKPLH